MAHDDSPSPSGQNGSESERSADIGRESDSVGSAGLRSVAKGTPSGDSGERQRLEPKDIELKEHSDIVYNSGATSRFDANIAAIKTLKKIESEGRMATTDEQK
jgi:hypothetical protein